MSARSKFCAKHARGVRLAVAPTAMLLLLGTVMGAMRIDAWAQEPGEPSAEEQQPQSETRPAAEPRAEGAAEGAVPAAAAREPLNSELIEARFGSYGIAVLASDDELRVSNLYSAHDDRPITRTFAAVQYPDIVDPAFAAEHALILAGASIGSTFVANGWRVLKAHRYFGEIEATSTLRRLMATVRSPLAVHVYELDVVRGSQRFAYAMIAEVHHPEYLQLREVIDLYAPGYLGGGGDDVDAMLEAVRAASTDLAIPTPTPAL